MRYPNPTFLQKASGIRHKRRNRTLIIIGVLLTLTLICIFVSRVAAMQDEYREKYPELVGAATSTADPNASPTPARGRSTTHHTTETSAEPTTEETSETAETTDPPIGPVINTEVTGQSSAETSEGETYETDENGEVIEPTESQNNAPDAFQESPENFYFRTSYPLQTVSHEQRDIMLDTLKQDIQDYINASEGERICFRYISLDSGEELGLNELEPIVPAGSYALPVLSVMWDRVANNRLALTGTALYSGEANVGDCSFIADSYAAGKQFYTRTLAFLAAAKGDNLALNFIIEKLGGMERVVTFVDNISSYISFNTQVIYTDYAGLRLTGTNRSSLYDMANYAADLYYRYINNPDAYQQFVNDLALSEVPSAYQTSFGANANLILHCAGRNDALHAYTDIAIIDCEEPIVLAIYCECADADRADTIRADLATYVARYITACHN